MSNRKYTAAAFSVLAVGGFLAINLTGPAQAVPAKVHKSYVCKWVSTPGEPERLQTGQNPIWVDNNALTGKLDSDVQVGDSFSDGQIRSVVIVANTAKLDPEPGIDACTGTPTTTTTETTIPSESYTPPNMP